MSVIKSRENDCASSQMASSISSIQDDRHLFSSQAVDDSSIEVIVFTGAGKPVLHFAVCCDRADFITIPLRSQAELTSLSAACVAYQHVTELKVRRISSKYGTILSSHYKGLHVIIASCNRAFPFGFLTSLATLALTSITFLLSSAFLSSLASRPELDLGSQGSVVKRISSIVLKMATKYPLPCAVSCSVSKPNLAYSFKDISSILASSLESTSLMTHVALLATSSVQPPRLIASASQAHYMLTPLDIWMLGGLLSDENELGADNPSKVFLQAFSFNEGSKVFKRLFVQHCPESGSNIREKIWIVSLGYSSKFREKNAIDSSNAFIGSLTRKLQQGVRTEDLLAIINNPWKVSSMFGESIMFYERLVIDVAMFNGQKMIGTAGVFHFATSIEIMRVLEMARDGTKANPFQKRYVTSSVTQIHCPSIGAWVISCSDKVALLADSLSEDRAKHICLVHLFPWLQQNKSELFSKHESVSVPPRTPLASFLSPFES